MRLVYAASKPPSRPRLKDGTWNPNHGGTVGIPKMFVGHEDRTEVAPTPSWIATLLIYAAPRKPPAHDYVCTVFVYSLFI